MHAFVLKIDKDCLPFLIDSSERFCYLAVDHPTNDPREIDFNEAFKATTECHVYCYKRCSQGTDRDSVRQSFRSRMWTAVKADNKTQPSPKAIARPLATKIVKRSFHVMRATLGLRPMRNSLPEDQYSHLARPLGKNTNYFNFDPSPSKYIDYCYEFLPDGRFVVNIAGVENMAKGFCLDSWASFC